LNSERRTSKGLSKRVVARDGGAVARGFTIIEIMTGQYADLVIHPRAGTMEVAGSTPSGGYGTWAHSAKIEGAKLYALRINNSHEDLSQAEEVRVRFYPDGKCEEMTLLMMTDNSEMRGITLEITTALPRIMSDAEIRELAR
jgi:hypothetical protein